MRDFLLYFARRYIAGTERARAIEAAKSLNSEGLRATIDILGENVEKREDAEAAAREYLALLDDINNEKIDATISLKLTHLGLDISKDLARENLERVVSRAAELKNFVRVDMEGSRYTDDTIEVFLAVFSLKKNVGIAIQSALLRSREDIEMLIEKGASVRLVKGAYREPPGVAFQSKVLVDRNFSDLMKILLEKGNRPAIATHDTKLIDEAIAFTEMKKIKKEDFEFQMLMGIKRELQKDLARMGFNVRVYVPYGKDWLPYTIRRMRERKENIFFIVKNLLD